MEKDIKQHSITYNKGITNQPSYILTDDGELSECNGLTFENGELKPIQDPKTLTLASDGVPSAKILVVHNGRHIYESTSGGRNCLLYTNTERSGYLVTYFSGDLKDVELIGNIVVVSTTQETHYALWANRVDHNYTDLGTKIPEPNITMYLSSGGQTLSTKVRPYDFVDNGQIREEQLQSWTDMIVGTYDKTVKKLHQKKLFAEPFVARYAVELYDGNYIMISNPIMLLPFYDAKLVLSASSMFSTWYDMFMKGFGITCRANFDYSEWSDIVKGVSVFVSREVRLFNREADALWNQLAVEDTYRGRRVIEGRIVTQQMWINVEESHTEREVEVLEPNDDADIKKALREESSFFKLCDLGVKFSGEKDISEYYSSNVIDNIEVQQQLPYDDFHSHDTIRNGDLYSYNGRLHISGASRVFFGGFTSFFYWRRSDNEFVDYTTEVKLIINGQEKYVYQQFSTNEAVGEVYYYYPDVRAREVKIYGGSTLLFTHTLTEHPGLNGAYWFDFPQGGQMSTYGWAPSLAWYGTKTVPASTATEDMPNVMMVSEVDDPFLFLPRGYVKVGNTPIKGAAAVTMALSEYQHGHQPLVVFSDEGIWSLSIDSEGYYIAVQSVSREVCNNPKSITQVDNGIFFSSAKGLMYLATSGVKCVSQQMRGTAFDDFIDSCIMAYDYRDSLLYIYSTTNSNFHYIYNMKTGTFSTRDGSCNNVVNNYPDTIVQMLSGGTWNTYSLLKKPDEQDPDAGTYSATLTTRPMKFGNILTLKSIRQLRHLYAMNTNATVSLTIKASNDGVNWATLTSLRGKPWKLYRFEITMTNLKATDRYAGTVVWTQERRTEKLR